MPTASELEHEFRQRCSQITELDRSGSGSLVDVEPALLELVRLCRTWQQSQPETVLHLFDLAIRESLLEDDFIYCAAHFLKLSALFPLAEALLAEAPADSRKQRGLEDFCRDLQQALSDDWEDAVLWPSLSRRARTLE